MIFRPGSFTPDLDGQAAPLPESLGAASRVVLTPASQAFISLLCRFPVSLSNAYTNQLARSAYSTISFVPPFPGSNVRTRLAGDVTGLQYDQGPDAHRCPAQHA